LSEFKIFSFISNHKKCYNECRKCEEKTKSNFFLCVVFECGSRKCSNGEESEKKERRQTTSMKRYEIEYFSHIMSYFLQEDPMHEENSAFIKQLLDQIDVYWWKKK
jgi:hypothetical protein